jgi:hypothetical protein
MKLKKDVEKLATYVVNVAFKNSNTKNCLDQKVCENDFRAPVFVPDGLRWLGILCFITLAICLIAYLMVLNVSLFNMSYLFRTGVTYK